MAGTPSHANLRPKDLQLTAYAEVLQKTTKFHLREGFITVSCVATRYVAECCPSLLFEYTLADEQTASDRSFMSQPEGRTGIYI